MPSPSHFFNQMRRETQEQQEQPEQPEQEEQVDEEYIYEDTINHPTFMGNPSLGKLLEVMKILRKF